MTRFALPFSPDGQSFPVLFTVWATRISAQDEIDLIKGPQRWTAAFAAEAPNQGLFRMLSFFHAGRLGSPSRRELSIPLLGASDFETGFLAPGADGVFRSNHMLALPPGLSDDEAPAFLRQTQRRAEIEAGAKLFDLGDAAPHVASTLSPVRLAALVQGFLDASEAHVALCDAVGLPLLSAERSDLDEDRLAARRL